MSKSLEAATFEGAKRFARVDPAGPVRRYLVELTERNAKAMTEAVGEGSFAQAQAREQLTVLQAEFALAQRFDEEYFGRSWCVGHTQAIEQVASELGAIIHHHTDCHRDELLEALSRIKASYDAEGRVPSADVPVFPSSD